jgi:4-hydroxy-tetrahydrodipicolinate synthase
LTLRRRKGFAAAMLTGLYPMLFAFFAPDGGLRREAFGRQIEAAVAVGADGIAVLGLGTECGKLTPAERRQVVEWVAEDLGGRLPLAVTVSEPDQPGQLAFARFARRAGAGWVILQPPKEPTDEAGLIRFFGATADGLDCPVGIQNARQFLGQSLSDAGLAALAASHPNVKVVKAEDSAVAVARLVEAAAGRLAVFNGRAGLELTDNLRAGAVGMIPGIETIDRQARVMRAMAEGREAEAEAAYAEILPALVFAMQGLDHFLLYGKAIAAERLGLAPSAARAPAAEPHPQGLAWAHRLAAALGPLP